MASVNKVILVGYLGGDPELRFTKGGQAVANFSLATSERWTDKESGNKEEKTEWHNIVAWGKLGEICGEFLAKGKQVYIEGRIESESWEDNDGNTRTKTKITANNMTMLSGGEGGHTSPESTGSSQSQRPPDDDDIPF